MVVNSKDIPQYQYLTIVFKNYLWTLRSGPQELGIHDLIFEYITYITKDIYKSYSRRYV